MTVRATLVLLALAAATAGCAHFSPGGRTSECREILSMSRAGDHLNALNLGKTLDAKGVSCPRETEDALSFSRMVVTWANGLVKSALKQKESGDLAGARVSLNKALELYPRYYWAGKILKGLDRSISGRVEDLLQEANYLESLEDYDGAVERMNRILVLVPEHPHALAEKGRLRGIQKEARKKKQAQVAMAEARRQFQEGSLDGAEKALRQGESVRYLDEEAEVLLVRIESERRRATQEHLSQARRAEQDGDLDLASDKVCQALDMKSADVTLRADTVEYARILGMKLYSEGRFVQASCLWKSALASDPDNVRIRKYLDEVNSRLENLERIKEKDGPGSPR